MKASSKILIKVIVTKLLHARLAWGVNRYMREESVTESVIGPVVEKNSRCKLVKGERERVMFHKKFYFSLKCDLQK